MKERLVRLKSTVEKVLFFVSQFSSEGKINEGEAFLIAERTVKVCSSHFSRFQAEISLRNA